MGAQKLRLGCISCMKTFCVYQSGWEEMFGIVCISAFDKRQLVKSSCSRCGNISSLRARLRALVFIFHGIESLEKTNFFKISGDNGTPLHMFSWWTCGATGSGWAGSAVPTACAEAASAALSASVSGRCPPHPHPRPQRAPLTSALA